MPALIPLSKYPSGGAKQAPLNTGRIPDRKHPANKKGGSLLVNAPYLDKPAALTYGKGEGVLTVLYKTGAKVFWPCQPPPMVERKQATRGQIKDMSKKSRLNAAFSFANAPEPWEWMITLTRRKQPKNPKADLDKFTRSLRRDFDMACQWGWIMEYQGRGVVHHHIFLSSDFVSRNFDRSELRYRSASGKRAGTTLVAGAFDSWVVGEWIRSTGDNSADFRRFQTGGIVEVFRTPDAAARYVAKEAGKRCQKQLPKGVEGGRRWWWLSKQGRPKPVGRMRLTHWPLACYVSRVFDKSALSPFLKPLEADIAKPAKYWVDTGRQLLIEGLE